MFVHWPFTWAFPARYLVSLASEARFPDPKETET